MRGIKVQVLESYRNAIGVMKIGKTAPATGLGIRILNSHMALTTVAARYSTGSFGMSEMDRTYYILVGGGFAFMTVMCSVKNPDFHVVSKFLLRPTLCGAYFLRM